MLLDDLSDSVARIKRWLGDRRPRLAVVLGSGLDGLLPQLSNVRSFDYSELPDFPATTAVGHTGRIHSAVFAETELLIFQGRYHCYEGYSAWQASALVRLAAQLGCSRLLLTNAVGGIGDGMKPGDFMLVADHLNLTGHNPLTAQRDAFVDLSNLYRHDFYPQLNDEARSQGIVLHLGVLAWMLGPSYETPAEIRFLKQLGADAVTMSTIPEAITARYCGIEVAALSFVSNLAAGISPTPLSHTEVLAAGRDVGLRLPLLLNSLISAWP